MPSGSKTVRLGLVQMSMTTDSRANLEKALRMVGEAADRGAQVVCLPELFTSRYFPKKEHADAAAETIPGPTTESLARAARENRVVLVGGSIYEKAGSKRYNTAVVFDEEGKLLGRYRKVHIPQDEDYYEQNYFDSGGGYTVVKTRRGNIGVLICFDQWYPEPARANRIMGADLLFYPTAIGTVRGIEQAEGDWHDAWESVQRGHAISNSIVVSAVNRVGEEGEMVFWGGSFVSDQFGKVLFRAADEEGVFVVECDLALGREVEDGWGFFRNRKPSTYKRLTR